MQPPRAHASILGMAVLAISGSGARSSPPLPVGEWPTPNRTFRVATRAAFARRYTRAVGGDLILVGFCAVPRKPSAAWASRWGRDGTEA